MNELYLDNSATTPLAPEVITRMNEVMNTVYANPSSLHTAGLEAEKVLSSSRRAILISLGVRAPSPADYARLIFTGSGTEANNLVISGIAYTRRKARTVPRIITTADQHPSVLEPLKRLEEDGIEVMRIPTLRGEIDFSALEEALTENTVLVTIMLVNNETGALYDVKKAFSLSKSICPSAVTHCDAVQGYNKITRFSPESISADTVTLSAHKINGPKGIGALYVSKDTLRSRKISPMMLGGGQENGMRSGTENLIGIAGFASAAILPFSSHAAEESRKYLLDRLPHGVTANLPVMHAPHILNITLPHIKSETMLHYLSERGIYVSSGSACSSHSGHVSNALVQFGIDPREADCSMRISLDDKTPDSSLDRFISVLSEGINSLAKI